MTVNNITVDMQSKNVFALLQYIFGDSEHARARASAEPQRYYKESLSDCPVKHFDGPHYSVRSRDDVVYLNKHPSVVQGLRFLGSNRPASPLGLDGPDHQKYRKLMNPLFTASRVQPLAKQLRQIASDRIDSFIDAGNVDVYQEWCEPLPSAIFLSIMGLPMEDLDGFLRFKRITLNVTSGGDDQTEEKLAIERAEGVKWIHEYFTRELDAMECESEPRDDIIGWLIETEVDGDKLNRQDLMAILGLFIIAGLDTVAASLSCMLAYLARHDDVRASIVADLDVIPSAIEEMMRFETPVTDGFRVAAEDLTLPSGTEIPIGSWMHISWAAANLDPEAFPDPLDFDIERSPNPPSASPADSTDALARMEMRAALEFGTNAYRITDCRMAPFSTIPAIHGHPRSFCSPGQVSRETHHRFDIVRRTRAVLLVVRRAR